MSADISATILSAMDEKKNTLLYRNSSRTLALGDIEKQTKIARPLPLAGNEMVDLYTPSAAAFLENNREMRRELRFAYIDIS